MKQDTCGKKFLPTFLVMQWDGNLPAIPFCLLDIERSHPIITSSFPTWKKTIAAGRVRFNRCIRYALIVSDRPYGYALFGRRRMAPRRLSRLQRQILKQLIAEDRRTQGRVSMSHFELVQTLGHDKSNVSHSLPTLETRGLIRIGRTPGGQANFVDLTAEGRQLASYLE
jgi:DNA-binding MarR family transcriptional regulator